MNKQEKYYNYVVNDMLKNSHYHESNPSNIVMIYGTAYNKQIYQSPQYRYIHSPMLIKVLQNRFGIKVHEFGDIIRRYLHLLPGKYE